jgi:hypothetical protein
MKHYYLEESIENLMGESCATREEALKAIEMYYHGIPKEMLLELLIRGQIHAREDKRTNDQYEW